MQNQPSHDLSDMSPGLTFNLSRQTTNARRESRGSVTFKTNRAKEAIMRKTVEMMLVKSIICL